jgi:glycine cleavage system aminomethyltransferase T
MARDRAGHVNRMFRGLKLSQPVAGGTKLLAADGKEVGVLTSNTQSPRLGPIGLGYIRRGSEQPGTTLTLASPADGTATVTDFPIR